jgi:hypothetical protein
MASTPALPESPAVSAGSGITRKERRNWLVAMIVAFVLGFLLAWYLLHKGPPRCPNPADVAGRQAAQGDSGGHGAPVRGSPVHLGAPDSGTADRKGSGDPTNANGGGGAAGKGAGGDGDLGGGHPWQTHGGDESHGVGSSIVADKSPDGSDATGEGPDGGGPDGKQSPPAQAQKGAQPMTAGPVPHGSGGSADIGAAPTGSQPDTTPPGSDAVVARDFRYDKSDLPRYPNAVTKVGSGTSLPQGSPTPNPDVSVSEILSTDGPQTVAAWYHEHLPPNWNRMNLGELTMFWPPDRKADPRSVWILVDPKSNQTAAILWKPKQAAP